MKKLDLSLAFRNVKNNVMKHSPEILMGFGITGMITTTVLAVKATPKALSLLEEEKKQQDTDELTPKDVVLTTWKCYIPAAVTCGVSVACLIGSAKVNHRRNAALATAYSISETALKEYREKVVETIGEKKEQAIRDQIAEEKLRRDPVKSTEVIITGKGETLCYDSVTCRYFKCDIEKLRKVQNELNHRMLSEMYISLNDFYYEVGLSSTEIGDDLGWNLDGGLIEFDFSSQLAEDGTPCLVIGYRVAPRYDFRSLM